jgi:urea transport system ATP-binding protein
VGRQTGQGGRDSDDTDGSGVVSAVASDALGTGEPAPESAEAETTRLPPRESRPSVRPKAGVKTTSKERLEALTHGRKAVLCVDSVSVSFDGFKALNELTLVLDEGELRCIIGPNGAGKTTLMDVITGKTMPDEGTVFLVGQGRDLLGLSEYEIAELGICRKFQRPTVFPGHTVFENLELAVAGKRNVWHALFGKLAKDQRESMEKSLETVGLVEARNRLAGELSHGQKQWLEIGMLLVQSPRVLLVDEPVAGMTMSEMDRTAELLSSLAGERTVVVVEHDMDFVRSIAHKVTVLHEGSVLAEGSLDEMKVHPRVVEVYLGAEHAER